ncbi:MAG: hypothetical protein KAR07_12355 [Spirochaetes bacterium]|nr:hypothetical protein [Spirochaetota bacterium]
MSPSLSIKKTISVLLLLFFCTFLHADLIYLKNGDKIRGEVIFQDMNKIRVKTPFNEVDIPKIRILKIEKEKGTLGIVNIHMNNRHVYRGTFIEQNEKVIIIKTNLGKKIRIPKKNISRMDWKKAEKKKTLPSKKKSLLSAHNPWNSVWHSALIPSWGQFRQGKKTKAWIIAGAMGISLTGTLISYINTKSYVSKWNAGDHSQETLDKMYSNAAVFYTFSIISASIYILQILDAGIFTPKNTDIYTKPTHSIRPIISNNGFYLFFEKKF